MSACGQESGRSDNATQTAGFDPISPQFVNADLGTQITKTTWMGVAWPVVLRNTMTADPMQRLGSLPQLDS
jgi:hypothetical protein